jgi:two-component sensor histidine kinase
VKQIVSYLSGRYSESHLVRTSVQLEAISLDVDRALPLALIANEAITNAYTHAYPDGRGGVLAIRLVRCGAHRYRLEINDDGPGLPPRCNVDQPDSLGLNLMRILARQIDATLDIRSGNGTRVALEFATANETSHDEALEA